VLRALTLAVAVTATLVVTAACGEERPAASSSLEGAFEQSIHSAQLSFTLTGNSAGEPFGFSFDGPYQSNGPGQIPSVDLRLRAQATGTSALEARLISDTSDFTVSYGGETYHLGDAQTMDNEWTPEIDEIARGSINLRRYIHDAEPPQDATLDGEAVTRFSGRLDSRALFDDLQHVLDGHPPPLEATTGTPDDRGRFEVDVAQSDGKLRRISGTYQDPDTPGNNARFELRFTHVDEPQTTAAPPAGGRPIGDLYSRLTADLGLGN
jgi:hypothetical protein